MATYNGAKYIKEQLDSIIPQLREDDELIVSDDASKDDTLKIVQSYNDPRIKIFHNENHGVAHNFENAMRQATGDLIYFADQDDVWLPGKYERCLQELRDVDLVCTNSQMTDGELNIIEPNFFSVYHSGPGVLKNAMNNTYYGSCMAFRRTVLEAALPMPPTREIGHDIWLGLVAEMTGKVRFIDTPYLLYRRHEDTKTSTKGLLNRSKRPLWLKIWSRAVVLYYVCKFKIKHGK